MLTTPGLNSLSACALLEGQKRDRLHMTEPEGGACRDRTGDLPACKAAPTVHRFVAVTRRNGLRAAPAAASIGSRYSCRQASLSRFGGKATHGYLPASCESRENRGPLCRGAIEET
jgi:hypothetical protein